MMSENVENNAVKLGKETKLEECIVEVSISSNAMESNDSAVGMDGFINSKATEEINAKVKSLALDRKQNGDMLKLDVNRNKTDGEDGENHERAVMNSIIKEEIETSDHQNRIQENAETNQCEVNLNQEEDIEKDFHCSVLSTSAEETDDVRTTDETPQETPLRSSSSVHCVQITTPLSSSKCQTLSTFTLPTNRTMGTQTTSASSPTHDVCETSMSSETLAVVSTSSSERVSSNEDFNSDELETNESLPPQYHQLYPLPDDITIQVPTSSEKTGGTKETCGPGKLLTSSYENRGFTNQNLESNNTCKKRRPPDVSTMNLGTISITIETPMNSPGGLPTYKSLAEFVLLDAPPNYEIVTGKKVEYDQIFTQETVKSSTRNNSNIVPLTFGRKIFLIIILAVIGMVTIALVAAQQLAT